MTTSDTCPSCGAENASSNAMQMCTRCKLPNEIRDMGHRMVARWKKMDARARGDRGKTIIGGSAGKKRNKHGRKGASKS